MKKYAQTVIKGILLTLVFVLTFNLSFSQVDYQTDQSHITTALAQDDDVDMDITPEEVAHYAETGESLYKDEPAGEGGGEGGGLTPEDEDLLGGGATSDSDSPSIEQILAEQFPQEAFDPNSALADVNKWASVLHMIFHPMINFLSFQIGNFLGIDYIYEGAMGNMLKLIWTVSRNIVNIIFVLILLVLALREIFDIKGGAEGGKLKDYLIKFTLLLVAVNFSWLATKVVLDAANVATNIVFSIPMGVARTDLNIEYEPCVVVSDQETEGQCLPTAFWYPYGSDPGNFEYRVGEGAVVKEGAVIESCNKDEIREGYDDAYFLVEGVEDVTEDSVGEDRTSPYWNKSITCWGNMNLLKYNRNGSVVYLTYGMARIQNLIKSSGGTLAQISVGTIMSLLLQGAYTVTLLALFIALIIRMAVLWIFVAFSPFLVLMLFSEKFKIAGDKIGIAQFIKWAFVPVKVGAVFTVVFLMISAGQSAGYVTGKTWDTLNETGTVTNSVIGFSSLISGMDSMTQFIWLLVVLGVLWVGVFSVLGDMPIVGQITNTIDSLGKRAGTWMAKTPYWAPAVPIYDHKTGSWKRTSGEAIAYNLKDKFAQDRLKRLGGAKEPADQLATDSKKRATIIQSINKKDYDGAGRQILIELELDKKAAIALINDKQFKPKLARAGFGTDQEKVLEAVKAHLKMPGGVAAPPAAPPAAPAAPAAPAG